ncbi:glucose dehydrogenase [Rhodococcoides trifolii]|uniref:Glucose dehydrogenase n=1 Tax=Rhodococcoides trifolii TaxID=908250 RepID=A0A917CQT6_9NOCA|nr:PQQ-dependent sugar dehydrogenase [Rhodococcus trifolii]GGF94745.1 glucose dehydrogenase [Rhodococcus trifolii]
MTRIHPTGRRLFLAVTAGALALTTACSSGGSSADAGPVSSTAAPSTSSESAAADSPATQPAAGPPPDVDVTVLASGLDHPWDVVRAPDGTILTGERSGRFVAIGADGQQRTVAADMTDFFAGSETGLMGIALATDFASTRTLYTCQGFEDSSTTDIRVQSWTAAPDWSSLTPVRTVVDGFPVTSGRHGGCRILPRDDGTLLIGTGDSAQASVPQDRNSLGGKVLRVDAVTGQPPADNPDPTSPIFTLGHRNVQGLAARPGSDQVFSVEQGTSRDDEVNLLESGANYGYRPDRNGNGYDESVAMTDPERVPGALAATWSSGPATVATASGSFLTGAAWGSWNGALAVGVQKDMEVLLLQISDDGKTVTNEAKIDALSGTHGRIRTVSAQPDGSLLVTTDNGDNEDEVLVVTPK